MKKLIALLASLTTVAAMGTDALSASAAIVKTEPEGYDYYDSGVYYAGEYGNHEYYYYFYDNRGGECWQYDSKYSYVCLTVSDDADTETLSSILGEETTALYYTFADDLLVFKYSPDVVYEELYAIAGVEKVELARYMTGCTFNKTMVFYDAWAEDNGIDLRDNNLLISIVWTDPDVILTPEMFACTGYTVEHVYQQEPEKWLVYFDYTSAETPGDFVAGTQEIDGVQYAMIGLNQYLDFFASMAFDTVVPDKTPMEPPTDAEVPTEEPTDAEVPTEEPTDAEVPTEEPTDAEVPTKEPTDAEVPTEVPTDAEVPTEEPTDTEAPTEDPAGELPQTGMPWARAVQGLAAVLAIGGGALFVESRRKDKNVDENML